MTHRIHLFGASGSGTTTLGAALADRLGVLHQDTDDYYWAQTDPPFTLKNEPQERIDRIRQDRNDADGWVLSGSLCNWGTELIRDCTVIAFVHLDQDIRMERLQRRENERYGSRIHPDGDLYRQHQAFMAWAKSYDTAIAPVRSRDLHEQWMAELGRQILHIQSDQPVSYLVAAISAYIGVTPTVQ